jgi:DNA-binding transcriptional LysR family regulator
MYPDVSVDLHLSDAKIDLIGDGFDAALRIAVLEDSSLVARLITPMRRYVLAAPAYIARYGRPQHPHDLVAHHCLGYAYRAQRDVWRFTNPKGDETSVTPTGPLRVTNVDALLPTLLAGLAIAELPEFIAAKYVASGALQILLTDWQMAEGGLYFVTPTARVRPAKIAVLSDFLIKRLSSPGWRIV